MKRCYIVDIDGTVADASHRVHHIKKQPKDWDAFFAGCADDKPIRHMTDLVSHMWLTAYIVFVSGRPEWLRDVTTKWLYKHGVQPAKAEIALYMRPEKDRRDDDIIKFELLHKLREDGWDPVMAFDDRDRIVRMWRANGIPCLQVAEGDF